MSDPERDAALADGTYDVFVVNATLDDAGAASLELAVVSGAAKGDVVQLRMNTKGRDPVGIIGLPGTLTVADGRPSLRIDA